MNKEGNGFGVRKRLPIHPCAPPPADEEEDVKSVCVNRTVAYNILTSGV